MCIEWEESRFTNIIQIYVSKGINNSEFSCISVNMPCRRRWGITSPIHNLCATWGWAFNRMPRPPSPWWQPRYPSYRKLNGASESVWTGMEKRKFLSPHWGWNPEKFSPYRLAIPSLTRSYQKILKLRIWNWKKAHYQTRDWKCRSPLHFVILKFPAVRRALNIYWSAGIDLAGRGKVRN